jgi:hypothetical protein
MPRQSVTIERDIPLFLIPLVLLREVRRHGEELERVIVRKTSSHFFIISVSGHGQSNGNLKEPNQKC